MAPKSENLGCLELVLFPLKRKPFLARLIQEKYDRPRVLLEKKEMTDRLIR